MAKESLILRWGVWICYTEWRPDQPHEDWSGGLSASGGELRHPQLLLYHGCWGAQHRTAIDLSTSDWKSPRLNFPRPIFGYKGLEGLRVELDGSEETCLHFRTPMLTTDFMLGDIPMGGWLVFPAGSKYSCSQLVVCREADEGIYWNAARAAESLRQDGRLRAAYRLPDFRGDYLPRELHHSISAWVPPGGQLSVPVRWDSRRLTAVTWRFTATFWAAASQTSGEMFSGCNSPWVEFETALNGRPLSRGRLKAKYMRGGHSALEHVDEVTLENGQEHTLSIVNRSSGCVYLVLHAVTLEEVGAQWPQVRTHLPFKAEWFDGTRPDMRPWAGDLPSAGRGLILGYDTNMMAAENGWIDAAIRYMAETQGGNYLLFRTESDVIDADQWRKWFALCRELKIYFAINISISHPALPIPELLAEAVRLGGDYFIGMKQHELSLPLYAGWSEVDYSETRGLAEAETAYLEHVREAYRDGYPGVNRLLGEAMLAHRYAYKAGVDIILAETMTGNTSLLLAEARGSARAYGKTLWGLHIACHVHCSPEDWRHERMFWLNLYLGYLSGASLIEDEEGGLAKVHSFVSGPSDPLPACRQATMARFFRWAASHPRPSPLKVDIGFWYGRHEALTGGLSLNPRRAVRVWEGFGPSTPEWEYGRPERSWMLLDLCLPGVWLCPVLRDPATLRRWFAGTPFGQVDLVPAESEAESLNHYRVLVCPGWHTMTVEDAVKLTAFVENGGTLILGLPQLQMSDQRTQVLRSRSFSFIASAEMERLCGFTLRDGSLTVQHAQFQGMDYALSHSEDGALLLARIAWSKDSPVRSMIEAEGHPLLVEHRLGRGHCYTFTALDYVGHQGFMPLVKAWLGTFFEKADLTVHLEGGEGEVAYFVYPEGDHMRVFLINTDWTVAGNVKICRVWRTGGVAVPVEVREGEVAEVVV